MKKKDIEIRSDYEKIYEARKKRAREFFKSENKVISKRSIWGLINGKYNKGEEDY
jgi:hypothetical protein